MLLRFGFNNLYSYKNDVYLDFTYHTKRSSIGEDNTIAKYIETYQNSDNKNGKSSKTIKVTNGNIIYGANASGKSNLIFALKILQGIFINGIELDKQSEHLPVFKFIDESNKKVKFNIEFLNKIDNVWYKINYTLIITENFKIFNESLSYSKINNNSRLLGREKIIFDRHRQVISFVNKKIKEVIDVVKTENIKYDLILTKLVKGINKSLFEDVVKTIEYKIAQTLFRDVVDKLIFISIDNSVPGEFENEFKTKLENKNFKRDLLKELKKLDFSIQDIAVREAPADNQNELNLKQRFYFLTTHEINDKKYTLNYGLESIGTRSFIRNYIYLFNAMKDGKVVIIDEFENSYHPELQEELLNQLLDNSRNNSGFQFLLTTHNTHYMSPDYFSKDQINFVNKDRETQISDIYKLSDYPDVSYKDDWEKLYKDHRLGGVPNIE